MHAYTECVILTARHNFTMHDNLWYMFSCVCARMCTWKSIFYLGCFVCSASKCFFQLRSSQFSPLLPPCFLLDFLLPVGHLHTHPKLSLFLPFLQIIFPWSSPKVHCRRHVWPQHSANNNTNRWKMRTNLPRPLFEHICVRGPSDERYWGSMHGCDLKLIPRPYLHGPLFAVWALSRFSLLIIILLSCPLKTSDAIIVAMSRGNSKCM